MPDEITVTVETPEPEAAPAQPVATPIVGESSTTVELVERVTRLESELATLRTQTTNAEISATIAESVAETAAETAEAAREAAAEVQAEVTMEAEAAAVEPVEVDTPVVEVIAPPTKSRLTQLLFG
jgi:hypothetical protein